MMTQVMEVTPSQLVSLLREGTAPLKARAAIARGTLALPPSRLLESLEILAEDPEPRIKAEALFSLERLPATVVRSVAAAPAAAPSLLDRLARRYAGREEVALDIARNPAASDETLVFLASTPFPAVLAAIGSVRERLERSPGIVAALLANPARPAGAMRPGQELDECRGAPGAAAPAAVAGGGEIDETGQAFDAVLLDEEDDVEAAARQYTLSGDEALSARQTSIYALLREMTIGQKVALAVKGNREVRNLLVRENNKLLCLKVLENPRIGDSDVEAWAKSTNVPEEVLRGIAGKKEWCKRYPVVKALVSNPKAPLGVTLDFLKRLTLRDLEQLAKNRNVPETLRSAARRLHMLKRETDR
jgi:hypothetical protein